MLSNALVIESERHNGIPNGSRYCPFCQNSVENEVHFLLVCPTYNIRRDVLTKTIVNDYAKTILENNHGLHWYTIDEQFDYIMSNMYENIAKYVSDTFYIRTFLLSNRSNPRKNM